MFTEFENYMRGGSIVDGLTKHIIAEGVNSKLREFR